MINNQQPLEKEKNMPLPGRKNLPHKKSPGIKPVRKPVKRQDREQRRGILRQLSLAKSVALYLAFLAMALLLIAQSAFIAQLNYQIIQKENKLETLHNEKVFMEMKVIEQKTPKRIEKIAIHELEMRNPNKNEIINIE